MVRSEEVVQILAIAVMLMPVKVVMGQAVVQGVCFYSD